MAKYKGGVQGCPKNPGNFKHENWNIADLYLGNIFRWVQKSVIAYDNTDLFTLKQNSSFWVCEQK